MSTENPDDIFPTPPWERAFGAEVRRLRLDKEWSQSEVARRMEARGAPIHQQQLTRIETGKRAIRLNEAVVLSQIFDCPLPDIISSALDSEVAHQRAIDAVAWLAEAGERFTQRSKADFFIFKQAQESAGQAIDQFRWTLRRANSTEHDADRLMDRVEDATNAVRAQRSTWVQAMASWSLPATEPDDDAPVLRTSAEFEDAP